MYSESNIDHNCIFCKIITKKIPASVIAENDDIIVIEDRAPQAPIHYLIIPKNHIENVLFFQKGDCCYAAKMFSMVQKVAKDKQLEDVKLIINNGYKAGQRVFHLHMHFLAGKEFLEN